MGSDQRDRCYATRRAINDWGVAGSLCRDGSRRHNGLAGSIDLARQCARVWVSRGYQLDRLRRARPQERQTPVRRDHLLGRTGSGRRAEVEDGSGSLHRSVVWDTRRARDFASAGGLDKIPLTGSSNQSRRPSVRSPVVSRAIGAGLRSFAREDHSAVLSPVPMFRPLHSVVSDYLPL